MRLLFSVPNARRVCAKPCGDPFARHPAAGYSRNELDHVRSWVQRKTVSRSLEKQPGHFQRGALVAIVKYLIADQAVDVERGHFPNRWLGAKCNPCLHKTDQRFETRWVDDILFTSKVQPAGRPNHPLIDRLDLVSGEILHRLASASHNTRWSRRLRSRLEVNTRSLIGSGTGSGRAGRLARVERDRTTLTRARGDRPEATRDFDLDLAAEVAGLNRFPAAVRHNFNFASPASPRSNLAWP